MSTHPNAMLLCILTPDDLPMKTLRAIRAEYPTKYEDEDIAIGDETYHFEAMESDYDESYQIGAPEGSLVVWGFLTYGYGKRIGWTAAAERARVMEEWAKAVCEKHHCSYEICISANYW